MAYVARFSRMPVVAGQQLGSATVPRRGDKWYIDPEEVKHYDPPFHIKWGSAFYPAVPPKQEGYGAFQLPQSPYPRMAMYTRDYHSNQLKYSYGPGQRRNYGETMHILEDWLSPQGTEWVRENGQLNTWKGLADVVGIYRYFDEKYCISMSAPKVYPFDNLYVEQGGNELMPKEERPYTKKGIPFVMPGMGMQG